jgi:hypothetical protein
MKKTIFALLLISSSYGFAQTRDYNRDRNQPAPTVTRSFQRDHPGATSASWEHTNNQQWHAHYKDNNNHDVDTYYDRNGRMRDTHRELDQREVPRSISTQVERRYHANNNYHVARIERPNNSPLFEVRIGGGSSSFFLDSRGRRASYPDRH